MKPVTQILIAPRTAVHFAAISLCLILAGWSECSAATAAFLGEDGRIVNVDRPETSDAASALSALATPPTGLSSAVPAGTRLTGFSQTPESVVVDFSGEIIGSGLDDLRLEQVFDQVRATLAQFGIDTSIRLQCAGRLLSDYLPPKPVIAPATKTEAATGTPKAAGLSGKKISLSPGHGKVWTGSSYAFERPVYCSPLNREDDHNLEGMIYLDQYLRQDGATTKVYRCLNKSYGTHSGSGEPWWRVSAGYWLKQNGYSCSVYASSTGDCTLGAGASESSDSLRSRGLASDADATDIYVSLHSNGNTGDCAGTSCPNGTCTYYDTSSEHATWGAISQTLATDINNSIVDAIRNKYGDTTWRNRGALDSNGGFAETRIPNRAAVLIELAFHDSCDRDGLYLRDNFFRSTTMWATYKGICDYFGTTPTWDYYSDEYVTNDIPAAMAPGATATVHITFRNRGVLWNDARSFKLGTVGDSDPFTTTTRYNVGAEVAPGSNRTFTVTFTAPTTPGTYTTDWRMLREGVTWFGATLTKQVTVTATAGAPAITSQPGSKTVNPGGSVSFTVAATGSAPLSYQWRRNGADLSNGGTLSGVTTTALAITGAQLTNAGTYTVLVSNTNGSVLSAEAVLTVGIPGVAIGPYTEDWQGNPTSCNFPGTATTCGYTVKYIVDRITTNCTTRGGNATWNPGFTWSGRGWVHMDFQVPCNNATSQIYVRYRNLAGAYTGQYSTINECSFGDWMTPLDLITTNLSDWNGCYVNSDESVGGSGCTTTCNVRQTGVAQIHMYGSRWHYINDWTCLGGYASTSVSDVSSRAFAWGESGLYLYPAVDTTHGNRLTADLGLSGKTPGRITTGDCNSANTLNFKGNASAHGNGDNMDSYGFAWMFSPAGANPKLKIGSDDGNRLWVNGSIVNDTNASRSLVRDQDTTAAVALTPGWNRVLFKVHNVTSTFQGTVSLRSSADVNLNEASVNVVDLGGYYSYGVGYEQDSWYPFVYVTNFCGAESPAPNANVYDNDTTVSVSGTAIANGPVPFWRVMHYEWGYGLGGETDYSTVASSGGSWSHTQTGVTGHRRFHFFAVSKSGRTSFQDNGQTGGANWTGGGAGTYLDVFIDNQPPQEPGFVAAIPASASAVNLSWAIPLDQGVGIEAGTTEAADETGSASANYYRVGDVGVEVYRDGEVVSEWSSDTSVSDTGLAPNTAYSYTLAARDNNSELRGVWHNLSNSPSATVVWTLSVPPGAGSVTASPSAPAIGSDISWTAFGGFGPGTVQYYRYAWDTSATHTWTDTEAQWSSGTLTTVPASAGTWYLHVKGYNGANLANGTFDYAVTASTVYSQTNRVSSMVNNGDGTFSLTFLGTPEAQYFVVTSLDPALPVPSWAVLPNSTNTAPSPSGLWSITVTNNALQRFYRSAAVNPAP